MSMRKDRIVDRQAPILVQVSVQHSGALGAPRWGAEDRWGTLAGGLQCDFAGQGVSTWPTYTCDIISPLMVLKADLRGRWAERVSSPR